MVPAGDPTEEAVIDLASRLTAGDTIVDGGNSHYRDDVRRARLLEARGIRYVDAGTVEASGVWSAGTVSCSAETGRRWSAWPPF
jgi:6-phosphogluconate dehydrogenase